MIEESFVINNLGEFFLRGPRNLAFDIGANKGEWTHWLSMRFSHVLAVEPDPRARAFMRKSLPANARLEDYAVSDRPGVQDFYMRDIPDQSSILPEHPIGGGGTKETTVVDKVQVDVVTLDGLLALAQHSFPVDEVDFIKIDIEGAEHLALNGATPRLFRNTRWLIEIHDTKKEVGEAVRRLGHENLRTLQHPYSDAHPNHLWILVNEAR